MDLNKQWLCDSCVNKDKEWITENNKLEEVVLCSYFKIYFPYASECKEYELDRDKLL